MTVKRRERKLVANVAHQMVLTARQRIKDTVAYGTTTPGVDEHRKELEVKHKAIVDKMLGHYKAAEELDKKLQAVGLRLYSNIITLTQKESDKLRAAYQKVVNAKLDKLDDLENKAILLTVTEEGGMKAAVEEIQKGIAAVLKN